MAMRGDPTGIAQTCPLIDEVLRFITAVSSDNEKDENYQADCKRGEIVLEMIRKANSKLREFGIEQYERANEAERELKRACDRIDELEHSVKSYEKEIKDLEDILNSVDK